MSQGLRRSVELEKLEKGKWRARLAIYGPGVRKNLDGHGTNIPAALVALSRTIERWAAMQLDVLVGSVGEAVVEAAASAIEAAAEVESVELGGEA